MEFFPVSSVLRDLGCGGSIFTEGVREYGEEGIGAETFSEIVESGVGGVLSREKPVRKASFLLYSSLEAGSLSLSATGTGGGAGEAKVNKEDGFEEEDMGEEEGMRRTSYFNGFRSL